MQPVELTVGQLFAHGASVHPDSAVVHFQGDAAESVTFAKFAETVRRTAAALRSVGVGEGDVVATLCWNSPAHLAAYFAVPAMGAVLHTLNLRLHDEQLVYIANHANDKVVIVDADLAPQLGRILERLVSVETVIVAGGATVTAPAHVRVLRLADLLGTQTGEFVWPEIREKSAAALCYTTGTTGAPKGVAYTHRSIYLHSLMISTGSAFGFSDADRVLPIVPMFHANAWGWPHAAWMSGADIILNDRFLAPAHLARILTDLQPTVAAAVPTIWTELHRFSLARPVNFGSLRMAVSGGSPLTKALASTMLTEHGVELVQGWGMTETSPLLTISRPPAKAHQRDFATYASMTGRVVPGVSVRVTDETGTELPWDGVSVGELQLRGATVTGSYFEQDAADKFDDGWLRTGDLGVIHRDGWIQIKDRLKDGIKSGGEWISTVELEQALSDHPAVNEVAVIGIPDPKWEERPLVCICLGAPVPADDLRKFIKHRVSRWWLPEYWSVLDTLPKTSVGKVDKKELRRRHSARELPVDVVRDSEPER
jgi:fatty-acyl-CoA synthase